MYRFRFPGKILCYISYNTSKTQFIYKKIKRENDGKVTVSFAQQAHLIQYIDIVHLIISYQPNQLANE